ncbi:hypothetical protein [Pectobacterium polaris]|nr:hypothetical protein [Pectobacterium polaris]
MMIQTSKACAGRAIAPKQGENGSSENEYQHHQGGGGGKSLTPTTFSTAA